MNEACAQQYGYGIAAPEPISVPRSGASRPPRESKASAPQQGYGAPAPEPISSAQRNGAPPPPRESKGHAPQQGYGAPAPEPISSAPRDGAPRPPRMNKKASLLLLTASILVATLSATAREKRGAKGAPVSERNRMQDAARADMPDNFGSVATNSPEEILTTALSCGLTQQEIWELMDFERHGVHVERVEMLEMQTTENAANHQCVAAFFRVIGIDPYGIRVSYNVCRQFNFSKTGDRWLLIGE